jgi:hypothetical protein
MSHLVPCPECNRHIRVTEAACPFCALPLDLAATPEPQLPRARLSRAATLAFGATLVSATALAACSSDSDGGGKGPSGGAAGMAGAAGAAQAGAGTVGPVYGAPAGGAPSSGTGGNGNGSGGGPVPVYGAAP